jgi:aspartyl aminopeptidase
LKDSEEKDKVKANILKLLKEKYDIEEEDFISGEIEVVPAGKSRDFGLDRSMIMAYGQDDRVCAYTSLMALLAQEEVMRTCVGIFVDKEEIGSVGASSMGSKFFENTIAEVLHSMGKLDDITLRRTLARSKMLSSDVSAAYDPAYASVFEKNNTAYFGHGVVFNKYTGARGKSGSNDAGAEYMARIRRVMDAGKVAYQVSEMGRVDAGGGNTIAWIPAAYDMDVVDCGVAVLSMHAPWEITSKSDIYEAEKCYEAFLNTNDWI